MSCPILQQGQGTATAEEIWHTFSNKSYKIINKLGLLTWVCSSSFSISGYVTEGVCNKGIYRQQILTSIYIYIYKQDRRGGSETYGDYFRLHDCKVSDLINCFNPITELQTRRMKDRIWTQDDCEVDKLFKYTNLYK